MSSKQLQTFRWKSQTAALLALAFLTIGDDALAQSSFAPSGVFVEGGSVGRTWLGTLGATWDTPYRWSLAGGSLSLYGEASVAHWSYPTTTGHSSLTQIAAVPTFRFRGDGGASRWFGEAGIGLSLTDSIYDNGEKHFSTRFNFADHLGVGRNFGADGQHEVALRVEHFSNGGIKEPNPGKTFVQLRYAYRFR